MSESRHDRLTAIIQAWCRFQFDAGCSDRIGPNEYSCPSDGPRGAQGCEDWASAKLVYAALAQMGRGAYRPVELERLLAHVYHHGEPIESFALHRPGRGMSAEMIGLGMRSADAVSWSLRRFLAILSQTLDTVPVDVCDNVVGTDPKCA